MTQSIKGMIAIFMLSLFLSCNSSEKKENVTVVPDALDSLIMTSQKNFEMSGKMGRETDSAVTTKVNHTVNKITKMEGEIKQLKQENNELKSKLDDANDDGEPFNIRTISNN